MSFKAGDRVIVLNTQSKCSVTTTGTLLQLYPRNKSYWGVELNSKIVHIVAESDLKLIPPAPPAAPTMSFKFKIGDQVEWKDDQGHMKLGIIDRPYPSISGPAYEIMASGIYEYIVETALELHNPALQAIKEIFIHDLAPKDSACAHDFKRYTGLTETYDYCVKCDQKR